MSSSNDIKMPHLNLVECCISEVTCPEYADEMVTDTKMTKKNKTFNEDFQLSYFQSALYATVLEDTIIQFRILEECNNALRNVKAQLDYTELVSKKFSVKQNEVEDDPELDEKKTNRDVNNTINKLDKDRKFILIVLSDTYLSLSFTRNFTSLTKAVDDILARNTYICTLEEDETKHSQIRRELTKQLRQQRKRNMASTYDTDAVYDELRTQAEPNGVKNSLLESLFPERYNLEVDIEPLSSSQARSIVDCNFTYHQDNIVVAETRSRFMTKWQIARTEQHNVTIIEKENASLVDIDFLKNQIDREERIHSEIETIVNLVIHETQGKVEEWMKKYDTEIEAIDLKIQIMKNNFDSESDRRLELETTVYAKHTQKMNEWREFKEHREKNRLYRLKMNQSAIIVQAWWRGILVRFQLGPYKFKKRRGGGKKKSQNKSQDALNA